VIGSAPPPPFLPCEERLAGEQPAASPSPSASSLPPSSRLTPPLLPPAPLCPVSPPPARRRLESSRRDGAAGGEAALYQGVLHRGNWNPEDVSMLSAPFSRSGRLLTDSRVIFLQKEHAVQHAVRQRDTQVRGDAGLDQPDLRARHEACAQRIARYADGNPSAPTNSMVYLCICLNIVSNLLPTNDERHCVCVQCLVLPFTVNNSRELQTSKRCAVLATVHSLSVQAILVT
jgi:hypothetical protein